jgi:hypothetical protein
VGMTSPRCPRGEEETAVYRYMYPITLWSVEVRHETMVPGRGMAIGLQARTNSFLRQMAAIVVRSFAVYRFSSSPPPTLPPPRSAYIWASNSSTETTARGTSSRS